MFDGDDMSTFWSQLDGTVMNYWGSSREAERTCACGVIGVCDDESKKCNCDAGGEGHDFGLLANKDVLPVGFITANDISEGSSGTYYVGPLRCGRAQFGENLIS